MLILTLHLQCRQLLFSIEVPVAPASKTRGAELLAYPRAPTMTMITLYEIVQILLPRITTAA